MNEIWKDISGFEGLYQVSNFGRIKSFRKSTRHHGDSYHFLSPTTTSNGYQSVTLYRSSSCKKKFLVHRLVAVAFVQNPNGYGYINHMDENKANNNADNLEWCTLSYNNSYGTARLRQSITLGSAIQQLTLEGHPLAIYYSVSVASRLTGTQSHGIRDCCSGKTQSSGGYIWRYVKFTIHD